eukprot:1893849-Prymnesium_polylepis.1
MRSLAASTPSSSSSTTRRCPTPSAAARRTRGGRTSAEGPKAQNGPPRAVLAPSRAPSAHCFASVRKREGASTLRVTRVACASHVGRRVGVGASVPSVVATTRHRTPTRTGSFVRNVPRDARSDVCCSLRSRSERALQITAGAEAVASSAAEVTELDAAVAAVVAQSDGE